MDNLFSRRLIVTLAIIFGVILIIYGGFQYSRPQVVLEWQTASEIDTIGFKIYRSLQAEGRFQLITMDLVSATGDPLAGGSYRFVDKTAIAGEQNYYRLVEIETNGNENILGDTSLIPKRTGWIEIAFGFVSVALGLFVIKILLKPK